MNNTIYIRRRNKVFLNTNQNSELLPERYITSICKNIEPLGYMLSKPLFDACRTLSVDELTEFYTSLVKDLKHLRGAHRVFKPMYPNFPKQVMEMSDFEFYFNAILHYWTLGGYMPKYETEERLALLDKIDFTFIDLGTKAEFEGLFGKIVSSNTSLSIQDKDDITWYVQAYGSDILRFVPDNIPQKENAAFLASLLLKSVKSPEKIIGKFCHTATDVLRLAVAMSGGDVSLAKFEKLRWFTRPERRLLISLLAGQKNITDDMLRHPEYWKALSKNLHPVEVAAKYPGVYEAFNIVCNNAARSGYQTFGSKVHKALFVDLDMDVAKDLLSTRPGDFARRLDYILRTDRSKYDSVLSAFASVADRVATPVLLQVRNHFQGRAKRSRNQVRTFFPKGSLAKAKSIPNDLEALPQTVCNKVSDICKIALLSRFGTLPELGKCYIDENLSNYLVPFSQRSASKSLRTIVRGSRVPLPENTNVARFFVWWKENIQRADIDLSIVGVNEKFEQTGLIAYHNRSNAYGWHSGDITSAPDGACEFIDINIEKAIENNAAYAVMVLQSFTGQPYTDLNECYAGWMAREKERSGEIFEPSTVQDRFDVSAEARMSIPLVIDLINKEVIWVDLSAKNNPAFVNNAASNINGIVAALKSFVELQKPNLYDLLSLHAEARGTIVHNEEDADVVFSVANDTPLRLETIASEYMQ